MKSFSGQSLLTALTAIVFLLTIGSASGGNQSQTPVRSVPVRVTTGVEAVQGWETGLVKSNPNLGRWHWEPIYSYKQGYGILRQKPLKPGNPTLGGHSSKPSKSTFNYPLEHTGKPATHIPYSPEAMAEVQGRLFQPGKEQSPDYEPGHKLDVSGRLTNHPTEEPEISAYKHTYVQLSNPSTTLKYSTQKTDVYGQLLNSPNKNKQSNQNAIKSYGVEKLDKIKHKHKLHPVAKKEPIRHLGKQEN